MLLWQTGPSRATAGLWETFLWDPKHFRGAPLGRKFSNFFSKRCILVHFVFLDNGGAPKPRGARGSLPPFLPDLFDGPAGKVSKYFDLSVSCSKEQTELYEDENLCSPCRLII